MFEEDEEDYSCAEKVTLREQLAQIMYENKRLKEELDSLRRNSFGIEEHLNSLSHDFKKKDSDLKRSEQMAASLLKMIQEKDNFSDVLERRMEEVKKANKRLEISLVEVKTERDELMEQNEMLLAREKELKEKHNTIEVELSDLLLKFDSLRESNASYGVLLDDLKLQVQVLEDEKTALEKKVFDDKCGIGTPLPKGQCSPFNIGSPAVQRRLDFPVHKNCALFDTEFNHLNLKEELLIAKIQEKQLSVENLEDNLNNSERTVEQLSRLLQERLREVINMIVLLWNNADEDFELIFPPLKSNFDKLIGAYKIWSDGQLGEKNPLKEAPDAVREKEIIVNVQPASNRTVESISTATQTDRILLARAFEDFGPIHNVLDYKYNDVDMDLYRMSNRNTEVGDDHQLDKPGDGCNSSYSSTENITEECLTIHGNVRTKNAENNSTTKHTSDELDTMVAVQFESDIEALQIENINEAVSNADVGMVMLVDGKTTLSEEEVEKKFQEISLAFRTDMMMLQQRLIIRKRLKDQAELNLVKEIDLMKTKLNNLRHLCCDSDSLERLSDLRKHLDIVLASANYLSGSSEAYGFVQNEEKMSGAVSIIIKKIDSLERIQEEMSKSPTSEKTDNKRIQLLSILDDDRHEDRMLRRRSVAAFALNGSTKRRASIASVPRNSLPSDDSNGSQYSSYSSISSNRNSSGAVVKKISGSQSNSPKPISPLAVEEKTYTRFRKESTIAEDLYGMKFSQDYDNHISDESYDLLHASDEEISNDENDMKNDMALSVLRMSGSFGNRTRANSAASETVNIVDSLRKVVKWNVILVRNSRFQCPENIRQYVPFFITWYVVLLVGAIFTSGFLTGFNRCFNSQLLYTYSVISGIITFWIAVISMLLKCTPMKFTLVTALTMYLYSLNYTLHQEGIDAVFKRLGLEFEIIYTSGAPI